MRRWLERLLILVMLIAVVGGTLWLQSDRSDEPHLVTDPTPRNDPDYYIEDFTAQGFDEAGGLSWILEAERLVHYPADRISLLDRPHLVEFRKGAAPTHYRSEAGRVTPNNCEVMLTGNVRIVRGSGSEDGGGIATTDRMRVRLKENQLQCSKPS
ncbi:MAG: LPS export ABC transporter periplasmic protein LptC [Gammaproteobacteria bacterium]|jgi:lipopolysaccharide export system protein LptC|nr:LPS export ABC transporter periplasmic protein LptC [Gammaproteobacteria bacterium]